MKHGNKKGKAKATPPRKKGKTTAKRKTEGGSSKAAGAKAAQTRGGSRADTVTFSNPAVAAAFKRAVKKYPSAFRRLTD